MKYYGKAIPVLSFNWTDPFGEIKSIYNATDSSQVATYIMIDPTVYDSYIVRPRKCVVTNLNNPNQSAECSTKPTSTARKFLLYLALIDRICNWFTIYIVIIIVKTVKTFTNQAMHRWQWVWA